MTCNKLIQWLHFEVMTIEHEPTLTLGRGDVEQHLRDALVHIAAAEALLQVDGAEAHPSLQQLTTQIIARTVAIEAVDEAQDLKAGQSPNGNGNGSGLGHPADNGHAPSVMPPTDQTPTPLTGIETNGANGNSTVHLYQELPTEAGLSTGDEVDMPVVDDTDVSIADEHCEEFASDEQSREPDSLDQLTESLNLSDRDTSMLKAILAQAPRGEWFSTGQIDFSGIDFVSEDAFRNAKAKLFVMLRDKVLIHNGKERGQSRYMVDAQQLAATGVEFAEADPPQAEDMNTVSAPDRVQDASPPQQDVPSAMSEANQAASIPVVEEQAADTPPRLAYNGDITKDRKTRRNDIIVIENLDELNEWVEAKNPYGSLPKVAIESSRQLRVNGKDFGLSDEQRELLNILLANYGNPLTKAEIFEMGFADVITGSKQRMKSFSGTIDRFMNANVDDEGNKFMLGDKLNDRGFMLNPAFRLVDERENVKKN